jgi:hypothetical protein
MANGSDHPGSNTVLVLGSNGKTGSRIVELQATSLDWTIIRASFWPTESNGHWGAVRRNFRTTSSAPRRPVPGTPSHFRISA